MSGAEQIPTPAQPKDKTDRELEQEKIVQVLQGYKTEAEHARSSGPNPRDAKWGQNVDLYWGRYDFSEKASWQAKEVMPEVPQHVDRFSAACKEALLSAPDDFYTVQDPADRDGDLAMAIRRALNVWLSICGRNQNGGILAFPSVFEEQVKLGAMMTTCSTVLWKHDVPGGRVAVESVDPRHVWLDPTFRNLYRIRRIELDWHDLKAMAKLKDSKGRPLFHTDQLEMVVASAEHEFAAVEQERTGEGRLPPMARPTVVLDEYLATVATPDGQTAYENQLFVVANDQFLIRGPEKNPFWHEKDWLLMAPLVNVPLSVYGRSYMEDFGSVAKTFNELTNMILDATFVSGMKVYTMVPDMLRDPGQALTGIQPFKTFLLEEGYAAKDFLSEVEMGQLSPDAVRVWEGMKNELREAAKFNEIGVGQLAPNSRTTATEIAETQSSTTAFVRSVAESIEVGWLNPTLDLIWKTGLQHVPRDSRAMRAAVGEDMWNALWSNRKELVSRPITFQARGISTMIQKARILKSLLSLLQIVAASDVLLQEFLRVVDTTRLVEVMFELSDVDLHKLQASQRTQLIRSVVEQMPQPQQGGQAPNSAEETVAQDAAGMVEQMGGGGNA